MVLPFLVPRLLSLALFLLISLLVHLRREIEAALPRTAKDHRSLLAVVLVLGLVLRLNGPFAHAVYMDEWSYLEGARTLLFTGRHELCRDGIVLQCAATGGTPNPTGYPLAAAMTFSLAGVGAGQAMVLNLAAGIVTIVAVYLLALVLLRRPWAALATATLMATLPLHVRHSSTAGTEAVSLLMITVALLCAALVPRIPRRTTLGAAILAAILAVSVRPENLLILPLAALFAARGPGRRVVRSPVAVLATLVLVLPVVSRRAGAAEAWSFSLAYVAGKINYLFFWAGLTNHLTPLFHTPVLPLLALGGVRELRRRDRATLGLLAMWFGSFFVVYLAYVLSASYRFMLACYPPILLLAGLGAEGVANRAGGSRGGALALATLLVAVVPALPTGLDPGDQHHVFQPEVDFLVAAARSLPPGCTIVTFNPFLATFATDRPALDIGLGEVALDRSSRGGCLALFEDSFCTWRFNENSELERCDFYHRNFELEEVRSAFNSRTKTPVSLSLLSPRTGS